MGLLRDRADKTLAALDEEIAETAAQLRQVAAGDDHRRELLLGQIDELLDRRLAHRQDELFDALVSPHGREHLGRIAGGRPGRQQA